LMLLSGLLPRICAGRSIVLAAKILLSLPKLRCARDWDGAPEKRARSGREC
jgi:hypothetical protein